MTRTLLASVLLLIAVTVPLGAAPRDAPSMLDGKTLGTPTDDTALVYVLHPGLGHPGDDTWWFVDERPIGVSKARGYSFAHVPEGESLFWTTIKLTTLRAPKASTLSVAESGLPEQITVLPMEFKKGETYYVEVISEPGVSGLALLDEHEGLAAIENCDYVALTAATLERGLEIAHDLIDQARRKAMRQEERARKKAERKAKKAGR